MTARGLRRLPALVLAAGLCVGVFAARGVNAQDVQIAPPQLGRSVHGTVLNALNQPLAQAIVYLKPESKAAANSARTAISDSQGNYAFYDLKANTSYEVYAVWKGHKSPSRTASQYSMQNELRLDLTIPIT